MSDDDDNNDVREELRRAEERIAQIRSENENLERQLLRRTGIRNRVIAGVIIALVSAGISFASTIRSGRARLVIDAEIAAKAHASELRREQDTTDQCKLNHAKTHAALMDCQRSLIQRAPWGEPDPSGTKPSASSQCKCQPNDPLCSCL